MIFIIIMQKDCDWLNEIRRVEIVTTINKVCRNGIVFGKCVIITHRIKKGAYLLQVAPF